MKDLKNNHNDKPPNSIIIPANGSGKNSNYSSKKTIKRRKTFVCSGYGNCSMAFTRAEHLARHIRKHTGEKPFQCEICLKYFSRIDNLKQHRDSVHARSTPTIDTAIVKPAGETSVTPTQPKVATKGSNIADLLDNTDTASTISSASSLMNNNDNMTVTTTVTSTDSTTSFFDQNDILSKKPKQEQNFNKVQERIYQQPLTNLESNDVLPKHHHSTPGSIINIQSSIDRHHNNQTAAHCRAHSYSNKTYSSSASDLDNISYHHQPVYPYQQHHISSVRQPHVPTQNPRPTVVISKVDLVNNGPSSAPGVINTEGGGNGDNANENHEYKNPYFQRMTYHYPPHYFQYQQQQTSPQQQLIPLNKQQYMPPIVTGQQNKLFPVMAKQNNTIAYLPLRGNDPPTMGSFNTVQPNSQQSRQNPVITSVPHNQFFISKDHPPLPRANSFPSRNIPTINNPNTTPTSNLQNGISVTQQSSNIPIPFKNENNFDNYNNNFNINRGDINVVNSVTPSPFTVHSNPASVPSTQEIHSVTLNDSKPTSTEHINNNSMSEKVAITNIVDSPNKGTKNKSKISVNDLLS